MLEFFASGKPAPQGSKRHVGGGRMVESSRALKPWRDLVRLATLRAGGPGRLPQGPVWTDLAFVLPRPLSTPKRSTPPAVKRPDLDKLIRAVLDAISDSGTWSDDSQVTRIVASKRLAEIGESPGVRIKASLADQFGSICRHCGSSF
jgi:crossover junction endodeoxyribonuclease RusA